MHLYSGKCMALMIKLNVWTITQGLMGRCVYNMIIYVALVNTGTRTNDY